MTKSQNSGNSKNFGQEIQENVNNVVSHNEDFNNGVIIHALDLKNQGIFQNPNPLTVTFRDIKKFDVQNHVICKFASQIKASKLTNEEIANNILMKGKISKIRELKKPITYNDDDDDDDNDDDDGGGGGAGDSSRVPMRAPPIAIPVPADGFIPPPSDASSVCEKSLKDNKFKIHIDTGNIYYDNKDINESIIDFILSQHNLVTGYIKHKFIYDRDYISYFDWVVNGFTTFEQNKLDVFKFKNSKYVFYRFNGFLHESRSPIQRIKHSTTTDDYQAAEEIQNQNWQYFVETILKISNDERNSQSLKQFQLETLENITISKKTYDTLFDIVGQTLLLTLEKISFEQINEIQNDFTRANFENNDVKSLQSWVEFSFKFGRFPGTDKLIVLPQCELPKFLKNDIAISPIDLFKKFSFIASTCCS